MADDKDESTGSYMKVPLKLNGQSPFILWGLAIIFGNQALPYGMDKMGLQTRPNEWSATQAEARWEAHDDLIETRHAEFDRRLTLTESHMDPERHPDGKLREADIELRQEITELRVAVTALTGQVAALRERLPR